jgi:tRNA nucleotidyltransferase/poly(A) polymerase
VLDELRALVPLRGAWLVGGTVRDLLLDRPSADVDVIVEGDPRAGARRVAGHVGGAVFALSERHGAWRVIAGERTIDVARARGDVVADLGQRDFTINAIAMALDGGEIVDPHGGRDDLDRRVVRAVGDGVFADDGLRLLRLARLAHELAFDIDEATERLARRDAGLATAPAGERTYAEVRRLLAARDPARGMRLLDRLGVADVVLPELAALRGVGQSGYHHLDAHEHTLHVLDSVADVAAHPGHYLPAHAERLREALARPVGDGLDGAGALRLAALFHDVAKPRTRLVLDGGRVGFPGHDAEGAAIADDVLARWHAAAAVRRFCRTMVREHLRLGFMVHRRPLDRREAYRYTLATAPWTRESVVLSLADRLATRGPRSRQRSLRQHAETADELLRLHAALEESPPAPLLRGDEIARIAGVEGAAIAELVAALAEEQAAGSVTTRDEALRFVRG